MHDHVHAAGEQGVPQGRDEGAGPAGRVERDAGVVALGGDDDQFDGFVGEAGERVRDQTGLGPRQQTAPGTETDHGVSTTMPKRVCSARR